MILKKTLYCSQFLHSENFFNAFLFIISFNCSNVMSYFSILSLNFDRKHFLNALQQIAYQTLPIEDLVSLFEFHLIQN